MLPRGPLPAALVCLLLSSLVPLSASAHGANARSLAFHERYAHRRALLDSIIGNDDSTTVTATTTAAADVTTTPVTTPSTTAAAVTTTSASATTSAAEVTPSSSSATTSAAASSTTSSSAVASSSSTSSAAPSSSSTSSSSSSSAISSAASSSSEVETSSTPSSSSSFSSSSTSTAVHTSTDAAGRVVTVTASATNEAASASASESSGADASSSSGLSTGAIIGISVVAGVVALGGGLYLIFALTKRRNGGSDDDGGIKWPELNAHGNEDDMMGVALPARPTGGAGLRTNVLDGEDSDDEDDQHSRGTHLGGGSIGPESGESYAYTPPTQPNGSEIYQATPYVPSPAGGAEQDGYYDYDGYAQQPQQQHGYDQYEPQQQGGMLGRSGSTGAGDALAYGGQHNADGYDDYKEPAMAEAYPQRPVAAVSAAFGGPRTNSSGGGGDDPFSAAGVSRTRY